jgi:hypothetical protein
LKRSERNKHQEQEAGAGARGSGEELTESVMLGSGFAAFRAERLGLSGAGLFLFYEALPHGWEA